MRRMSAQRASLCRSKRNTTPVRDPESARLRPRQPVPLDGGVALVLQRVMGRLRQKLQ
jgi:hypothetical protein